MSLEWRIGEMGEHDRRGAKTFNSPTGGAAVFNASLSHTRHLQLVEVSTCHVKMGFPTYHVNAPSHTSGALKITNLIVS